MSTALSIPQDTTLADDHIYVLSRFADERRRLGLATSLDSIDVMSLLISRRRPVSDAALFADDPVDGSPEAPDRLGREDYARHVVQLLDRVRSQSDSSVLALIGPWGSGKSSVLDMVARRLEEPAAPVASPGNQEDEGKGSWLVVTFNPWAYGDVESLQNGFFQELRSVLPNDAKWSGARKRIGEFGMSIAPLAGFIPTVRAEGAIKAMGEAIAGDQSATAMKAAAEDALRTLGRPILFILDDLDRLTPQELLVVFKLVRLVGRLPHVYYLLSYDESTLLDVLSRTELVSLQAVTDNRRARDYLEKIIQVRLDLPMLRESQALGLVEACLNHVLDTYSVSLEDENFDRFRMAFNGHMRRRLTTPRAINRYFAQVEALYVLLGEEIDFVDFLLLTWIRTAEPELYSALQPLRGVLTRSGGDAFPGVGVKETHQEARDRWSGLLKKSGVAPDNVDGVLAILAQMFLPIRSALRNMEYGSDRLDEIRTRRGVGHVDYYDRYFSFGVPSEDIADSVVRKAMSSLAAGKKSSATVELRSKLLMDTARVCRKLGSEQEQGRAPAVPLLIFLADLYGDLPESGDAFLDPRRSVQLLASDLLTDVTADDGPGLLRRMSEGPTATALVANTINKAQFGSSPKKGQKSIQWLDVALQETRKLIREFLDATTVALESLDEEAWRLISIWRWLDQDEMRAWLRSATADKPGWTVKDVLARLVQPARMDGAGFPPLDMAELEPLLGVEFALKSVPPLSEAQKLHPAFNLEPTWDNRARLARTILDEERERRFSKVSGEESGSQPERADQGLSQ